VGYRRGGRVAAFRFIVLGAEDPARPVTDSERRLPSARASGEGAHVRAALALTAVVDVAEAHAASVGAVDVGAATSRRQYT
jgi:hypothetical protein